MNDPWMKYGKMVLIFVVFCMTLVACKNVPVHEPSEYEVLKECDMGNIFTENDQLYHIRKQIKEHSVKVKNQKRSISKYEITLDQYFYNKNTGVAMYKFILSASDGSSLSDEQYKKLLNLHEKGDLDLINKRSSRSILNILKKDKDNQVVWYVGCLLSAISSQDKITDISNKDALDSVGIYFMGNQAGELSLPDYSYEESVVDFDVSKNPTIVSAKMTECGLCVIWNIEDVLTEFHKKIESLPAGEDPEGYNYSIYKDIYIHMKDGTKKNVLEDSFCDEEKREENKIASFSGIWEDGISLEDVENLEIDGRIYEIRR